MPLPPDASWLPISVWLFHYLLPLTLDFEKAMTYQKVSIDKAPYILYINHRIVDNIYL
jgi:hypothetical protein